jgi:hypothetical protein
VEVDGLWLIVDGEDLELVLSSYQPSTNYYQLLPFRPLSGIHTEIFPIS